jgi:hypothetical protein
MVTTHADKSAFGLVVSFFYFVQSINEFIGLFHLYEYS